MNEPAEEVKGDASREELNRLLKEREGLPRRLFYVALENLGVFGVPAGLAVYIGIQTGRLLLALIIAFVLSWAVFIVRFRALLREMNTLEKAIEAERKRLGIEAPKPIVVDEKEDDAEHRGDLP